MDSIKTINDISHIYRIIPAEGSPQPLPGREPARLDSYRKEEELFQQSRLKSSLMIAENIRKFLADTDVRLEFLKKQDTQEICARVIHNQSGKIIREYPVVCIFKYLCGVDKTT